MGRYSLLPHRRDRDEDGVTLLEVVVGMSLMMIFLGMFTGSIIMLTRTSAHNQNVVNTSSDLDSAFYRLDRTIRYAASISTPGKSSTGNWYVEYLSTNSGSSICTQLRIDNSSNQLQQRTWTVTSSGYSGLTSWSPMADEVSNGTAAVGSTSPPVPFTLSAAGGSSTIERLTVQLVATTGNPPTSSQSTITFGALNSATASTAAGNNASYPSTVCTQVARP